jgi:hypothetical protein
MSNSMKKFVDGKWRYVFEDGAIGMPCAPPTEEEQRDAENDEQRRKYQAQADDTGKEVWWRGEKFMPGGIAAAPQPAAKRGERVYKVVTQRDDYFGGKFDPLKLEQLMNDLAADGWRVVAITAADVSTFFGSFWSGRGARQEIIVFLERTAD